MKEENGSVPVYGAFLFRALNPVFLTEYEINRKFHGATEIRSTFFGC
jgi:hypothetical protein